MMSLRPLRALAATTVLACSSRAPRVEALGASPTEAPRELFRFHVDFWANLHEVLFHESLVPKPGFEGPKSLAHHSVAPVEWLDPAARSQWQLAVAYYESRFSTHNLFEPEFETGSRFLAAQGSDPALPTGGIADEWRTVLAQAAPVYRARFWPAHERRDRAYIDEIRPQLAAHGAWMARRLEVVYRSSWPAAPVLVEVTPTVPPFGASTVGEPPFTGPHTPLITVSSEDPGYATDTGLEMIFHEASHLLVDKVQTALETSAQRQARKLPDRFWHFLLFYTAGHLARERLGPGYVPYAERSANAIFSGRFAAYLPILERAWQPYLDGHVDLEPAIDALVAAF